MMNKKNARAASQHRASPRPTPIAASLMNLFGRAGAAGLPLLLVLDGVLGAQAWAQTRPAPQAVPSTPVTQLGAAIDYRPTPNGAVIIQSAPTNIVNWKSFDIGSAATLTIQQPSASAVLLNKVEGGANLNRTTIDGMLNANGRVYIYNPNGIVFGKTGQVNVNTLIASSLKFDEQRVVGGLILPGTNPVLGSVGANAGAIVVEGDRNGGAALTAANGGLILLAAPNVLNQGRLSAPDGQVILAAGNKVYLAAPDSAQAVTLRGLVVEVSNDAAGTAPNVAPANASGIAENGASGSISVGRGNATMIGYAVNQNGVVSATTSVSLNGSIYLYARDQASSEGANSPVVANRTGQLTLGAGSVTQVLPTLDDLVGFVRKLRPELPPSLTQAAAQDVFLGLSTEQQNAFFNSRQTVAATAAFNPSEVKLDGLNIALQQDAQLLAPNGNVSISARRLAENNGAGSAGSDINPLKDIVRVDLAPGSVIDVAGTANTLMAMDSNVVTVDLRGSELADNVVLRTSPLYASKARIDVRNGAKAAGTAANVSGWLALVEKNLGQLTAAGGTVNLSAEGAIIDRPGSRINVSGGEVDYLGGYVNTSKFKFNDGLVDIGAAGAGILYSALVNLPDSASNFEAGYRQGASAGALKLSAPIIVLKGDLAGASVAGVRQRELGAADFPKGARLEIGTKAGAGYAGDVLIGGVDTAAAPAAGAAFDNSQLDQQLLAARLDLDPRALAQAGFNAVTAVTSGNIEVVAPVAFAPGGKLDLSAGVRGATFADGLFLSGGNLSIKQSISIPSGGVTGKASGVLQLADGVAIDLAGRWTNDFDGASVDADGRALGAVARNGGTLNLSVKGVTSEAGSELDVGNGVRLDVSAGASLTAANKTVLGNAGSISLLAGAVSMAGGPAAVNPNDAPVPSDAKLRLGADVMLAGYGFGAGGKLKLTGRTVSIGGLAAPGDLALSTGFFQQGGFGSYDISANVNLDVAPGTVLAPRALAWQLDAAQNRIGSGAMNTVASTQMLELSGSGAVRGATSITLQAPAAPASADGKRFSAGMLTVGTGAQVLLDPGASLTLLAGEQLTVDGTLSAPGGHIALLMPRAPNGTTVPFRAERSIWFGPHARILANGSVARLLISEDGIASGDLLAGGSIEIGDTEIDTASGRRFGASAYIVAEQGALFDVSGVSAGTLRMRTAGLNAPAAEMASAGGSIDIHTRDGLLFDGTLRGAAGGANANGGSLSVTLDTLGGGAVAQPLNARILNILGDNPAESIVPTLLKPGDAVVQQRFAHDADKTDLGYFIDRQNGANVGGRPGGQGWLQASAFAPGGFARLTFKSDQLAFGLGSANLTIAARDALILDSQLLLADSIAGSTSAGAVGAKTLTLNAPYIRLGSADTRFQLNNYLLPGTVYNNDPDNPLTVRPALAGNAVLSTRGASTIDVIGNSALQGFSDATLSASADIRLLGLGGTGGTNDRAGYAVGSLSMVGNLNLNSAQVYPTTLSDFTLSVGINGADPKSGTLTFTGNHNAPEPVLSAGGSVTALASTIVQAGRLVAPFGAIYLGDADTASLKYANGSVTSVAGVGDVPFGTITDSTVAGASAWSYFIPGAGPIKFTQNPQANQAITERALPAKAIVSRAKAIDSEDGAVLDASGGGHLYAYAFTAGKGGSRDVLDGDALAGGASTIYAINPNFHGAVAPVDGVYGDAGLAPGNSVYLSGVPGLAAGMYTLLPAHYALLPGGFSISVAANTRDMQASGNVTLQDGSMLVSGYFSANGAGTQADRSTGFIVSSSKVVRSKSEFGDFDASSFFKNKATVAGVAPFELPVDGGYLAFAWGAVNANLRLQGAMKLGADAGGRRGYADFSAPRIGVVGDQHQSASDAITLVADDLTGLGADSVLIGALRSSRDGAMHLTDLATSVTVSNNGAHPLSGAEIVLVAADRLTLEQGAVVRAAGAVERAAGDIVFDGGGALVRVSGGAAVAVTHGASDGAAHGTLVLASGATVGATGAAYLDASVNTQLKGTLDLAAGSALGIGASGIDLGSELPQDGSGAGVQFDTAALRMLSSLSALSLNSYGAGINLYGDVTLGNPSMRTLSLSGAGLNAYGSAARHASFTADLVRVNGRADASGAPAVTGSAGSLQIDARQIEIGSGMFAIRGYLDSLLVARGELLASAPHGQLSSDRNLTLAAARIGSASAADASFIAGATLSLKQLAGAGAALNAPGMGGALSFVGHDIVSDANLAAPSGQLSMTALNDISITGGTLSAAGGATDFKGTLAYAPGGRINLVGSTVRLAGGALLDVSAVGAAAGTILIDASRADGTGYAQIGATLKGAAQAGADGRAQAQGRFVLSTDTAGGAGQFGALNAQLNEAGFTQARQFTFHQGDVALGGSDRITAQELTLSVDNGSIRIGDDAVIDASGAKGGSIALYAAQAHANGNAGSVTLADRAQLLAMGTGQNDSAAGSLGSGGRVLIGVSSRDNLPGARTSGGGSIDLAGGLINVSGINPARDGGVTLRAPRVGDNGGADVAIARFDTRIKGSAATLIDAYQVYTANSIRAEADSATNLDAGTSGLMYTQAQRFIGNKDAIVKRLGGQAATVTLGAGIEVRSDADLTVSVNEFAANPAERGWDLHAWRFGGAPVSLTLRAAGNLAVLGSISDGFIKPATAAVGMPDWQLGTGPSASYRLVGGADLSGANPLGVVAGKGDVLFGFAARSPTSAAPLTVRDAPVALVRTGTGRIDIAAGRDVTLAMATFWRNNGTLDVKDTAAIDTNVFGASVYTAGQASDLPADGSFDAPTNALNTQYRGGAAVPGKPIADVLTGASFGQGGGAISITAGRDINGPHNLGDRSYRLPGDAAIPPDPDVRHDPGTPATQGELAYLPGTVPQLINNWLFRQGRSHLDADNHLVYETLANGHSVKTAWWTRYDYFNQGVATFGGGDVSIVAGRRVVDLSASVATSAYATGAPGGALRELGGGDLLVRAGGDILGGSFYVQKGAASIHADGSIGAGNASAAPFGPDLAPFNPILALGDARLDVSAGNNLAIETAFNPTMTAQSLVNRGTGSGFLYNAKNFDVNRVASAEDKQIDLDYRQKFAQFSEFSTYTDNSAVTLTAIGGNLRYSGNARDLNRAGVSRDASAASVGLIDDLAGLYLLAPSSLRAVALSGDLTSVNGFVLAASPRGQLDLLAKGDITLHNSNSGIRMLDNDPAAGSQAGAPTLFSKSYLDSLVGSASGIAAHQLGNLHAGDTQPVHIIALTGDLVGELGNATTLSLPKAAQISAGGDIRDLGFRIQHNGALDVTSITAGRDFIDSTTTSPSLVGHVVTGAGRVDLSAGRNVDLGNGAGLVTRGNLDNPYLDEGGAGINVVAGGAHPDYAAFVAYASKFGSVSDVSSSPASLSAPDQRDLIAYVLTARHDLPADLTGAEALSVFNAMAPSQQGAFLAAHKSAADILALVAFVRQQVPALPATVTAVDAWSALRALSPALQEQFLAAHPDVVERLAASAKSLAALSPQDKSALDARFFSNLVQDSKSSKLGAFDNLIASLYPDASKASGDIALYNSQIKTEQGGAINLFAPGGSVYAGLTVGVAANNASKQGIFTIRGGDIAALVKNDFQVNQGRVFTLGGGDITLVSQYGSIDAGKGAKTASSAPPPRVTISANGSVVLDVSGSISGSGIATLKTHPDQPDSNVYALAPRGVFDAGDAGVRSTGSVDIVAPVVLNSANITVASGTVSGASAPVVAAPAAAPAAPANAAPKADDVAGKLAAGDTANANKALAVEVLGFGDDEDADGDSEEERKKKKKAREAKNK